MAPFNSSCFFALWSRNERSNWHNALWPADGLSRLWCQQLIQSLVSLNFLVGLWITNNICCTVTTFRVPLISRNIRLSLSLKFRLLFLFWRILKYSILLRHQCHKTANKLCQVKASLVDIFVFNPDSVKKMVWMWLGSGYHLLSLKFYLWKLI